MATSSARVTDRVVRNFVHDLLSWDAACAQIDRVALGSRSSIVSVLTTLELQVVGTGCSGTKGVGKAPADDREARRADPVATARYQALRGEDLRTADAVIADGRGFELVEMTFGTRQIALGLEQRVGFRLAKPELHDRWVAKIVARDSRPALDGSERLGAERLEVAARAWFAVNVG